MLQFLIPLLAKAVGPTVAAQMGLTGTAAALTPAVLSGLGSWAATGDPVKGLMSGALSALPIPGLDGAGEAVAGPTTESIALAHEGLKPAATSSGIMGLISSNPAMAVGLGAGLLPLLAPGQENQEEPSGTQPYPYSPARPRTVIPYSSSRTPGASTYTRDDSSMADSIYRYGQSGPEHVWFDNNGGNRPPPDTRPGRDGGGDNGGIGGIIRVLLDRNSPFFDRRFAEQWENTPTRGLALGGPVMAPQVRPVAPMQAPMSAPMPSPMKPMGGPQVRPPMNMPMPGPFGRPPPQAMGLGSMRMPGRMPPSPYMASGGPVRGPGTTTSDSVPAIGPGGQPFALSNGEYVLPAHMVASVGGGDINRGTAILEAARAKASG